MTLPRKGDTVSVAGLGIGSRSFPANTGATPPNDGNDLLTPPPNIPAGVDHLSVFFQNIQYIEGCYTFAINPPFDQFRRVIGFVAGWYVLDRNATQWERTIAAPSVTTELYAEGESSPCTGGFTVSGAMTITYSDLGDNQIRISQVGDPKIITQFGAESFGLPSPGETIGPFGNTLPCPTPGSGGNIAGCGRVFIKRELT